MQKPGFSMFLIPDGTQRGVERVLLPEQDASEPLLTCFMNHLPARHPASAALAHQTPAGVFLRDAQYVMPVVIST
jgi:hypothetical protein